MTSSGTTTPKHHKHKSRAATPQSNLHSHFPTPSEVHHTSAHRLHHLHDPTQASQSQPNLLSSRFDPNTPLLPSSPSGKTNWIRRDEHILPSAYESQLPRDTWIDRGESLLPFDDGKDHLLRDTWIDKGVSLFGEDTWISRGETMLEEDNWITRGESLLPEDSWVSQGMELVPNHERCGIDGLRKLEEQAAQEELERRRPQSEPPRPAPTRLTYQELS